MREAVPCEREPFALDGHNATQLSPPTPTVLDVLDVLHALLPHALHQRSEHNPLVERELAEERSRGRVLHLADDGLDVVRSRGAPRGADELDGALVVDDVPQLHRT